MQAKKMKALSVLSMAVAATMGAKAAQAATLTLYYDNITVLDPTDTPVQTYSYGTSGGNYTQIPTSLTIAKGDTVEFGVDAVVTNNVNPDGGKRTGGTKTSIPVQPTNLGLSTLSIVVPSSDLTGSILSPQTTGAPTGTFAGAPDYNSTASLNNSLGSGTITGPNNNPGGTAPSWSSATEGDVSPTAPIGAGDVGDHFAIFQGNGAPLNTTTAPALAGIAQYGASTASFATATDFFDSLAYTATGTGVVTLSPSVHTAGTSYWINSQTGSTTTSSGYIAQEFTQAGDVVGTLPVLVINVTGTGPTSHSIISLTAASGGAPTLYGSSQGTLTVTGGHGSYKVSQVTGLTTPTGYVEANGFNPGTDEEIYALDVTVNGTQANASEIGTLVSAINLGDSAAPLSLGVVAAGSYTGLPTVTDSNNPFGSQYNLFLDAAVPPSGDNFFGFDLGSTNDSNLNGYSVSAVAVVPEPMSLGLLAIGGLGLMSRRGRRKI